MLSVKDKELLMKYQELKSSQNLKFFLRQIFRWSEILLKMSGKMMKKEVFPSEKILQFYFWLSSSPGLQKLQLKILNQLRDLQLNLWKFLTALKPICQTPEDKKSVKKHNLYSFQDKFC